MQKLTANQKEMLENYIEYMVKKHKEQVECYSIYMDGKLEELHGFPVLYEEAESETSY